MTIEQPAGVTATIADLTNKVVAYLQNRQDASESNTNPDMRPSRWIRDTLRELTAEYPFEELRVTGPVVNVGPGLGWQGSSYSYSISYFLNPGDDYTLMEDPTIFLTPAQAASVGLVVATSNIVGYAMDRISPKAIQPLLFIPGTIPFKYCRYGNQFWLAPQPGSTYQVYLPYQRRHPFTDNLPESKIFVPSDWFEIVAISAAERGAVRLRWNEQASYLHELLYGDPNYQRSGGQTGRPGLLAAKTFQPERDARLSPIQVMIGAARY